MVTSFPVACSSKIKRMAKLQIDKQMEKQILEIVNVMKEIPAALNLVQNWLSDKKFLFMKKYITVLSVFLFLAVAAEAQYGYGPRTRVYVGGGGYRRPHPPRRPVQKRPSFQPTVNFSAGYGFPNLDKNQFAQFSDAYMGNTYTQNGPFTGAIDYQFSRNMSIGVMGTYGKVSVPYYNYGSSSATPDFTGKLENWSLMLNMMNYFPTYDSKVEPYLRTAVGINNWKQDYVDASGNKAAVVADPSQFAYQASLGARFNLSKGAGIYLEAGYGKYIVSGGLTLKF